MKKVIMILLLLLLEGEKAIIGGVFYFHLFVY